MKPTPKLLSVASASKYSGIGQNRLRTYVNSGKLKSVRHPEDRRRPRAMWIVVADLDRLIDALAA